MQRIGDFPLVSPVAMIAMFLSYVAAVGLVLAWALRVLEIRSIFDRWLQGSAWYLLGLFVTVMVFQGVWGKLLEVMGCHDERVREAGTGTASVGELQAAPASFDRYDLGGANPPNHGLPAPIGSKWGLNSVKIDDGLPHSTV